jgi:hypothetical protein
MRTRNRAFGPVVRGVAAALALLGLTATTAAAAPPAPKVSAQAFTASATGTLHTAFSCTAEARQEGAVDTVMDCYITNGPRALAYVPLGVVTTAAGVASRPLGFGLTLCVSAYSIDRFGVQSATAQLCAATGS